MAEPTHPSYPKAFVYTEKKMRATPADKQVDIQARSILAYDILALQAEIPFEACVVGARRGDLNYKLDFALRLLVGLGTKANDILAISELILITKANTSHEWEKDIQAIAHGLLLEYHNADPSSGVPYSTILEEGLKRVRMIVRRGHGLSPSAINFCHKYFAHYGNDARMEGYREVRSAYDTWVNGGQKSEEALKMKKIARPNRYRCAAAGCNIIADSGTALKRCSGECKEGAKPYYCSMQCQTKDWKVHRSHCKEGAFENPTNTTRSTLVEEPGEHIGFATRWLGNPKDAPALNAPKVTLPIRLLNGKVIYVTGQREALKNEEVVRMLVEKMSLEP